MVKTDDATASRHAARVRSNQSRLRSAPKAHYDFIICGSGSSGSVVARRLAEDPNVSVLLLEAGGHDEVESVSAPDQWRLNVNSERDWKFRAGPNPHLNGRSIPMNMGKVLGGGSSINLMMWSRGHKDDWEYFAAEAGDSAWGYESVLDIYRRIEDWHGQPDPEYRGTGGEVFVQPSPDPNPVAPAVLEAARSAGIPTFRNQNGEMMEREGGASIADTRIRGGVRQSVFRSYTYPYMDRPNLCVMTDALVTRVTLAGARATGVEFLCGGTTHRIGAELEVVLCMGAVNTPKILMLSGIGNHGDLGRLGIRTAQHLPGVGENLQDHVAIGCVWDYRVPLPPRNAAAEATFFWKSAPFLTSPDIQVCHNEMPLASPECLAQFGLPDNGWTLFAGVVRPQSRGRVRLSGPEPTDPIRIDANMLSEQADLSVAIAAVELCREVGNAAPLAAFAKREVMPGDLSGRELVNFIRDGASSYWHQTCTAKMGRDEMSVVDADLRVYGIDRLRVADGSIMPRVTTGNTMAPCVVIGERAAEILRRAYSLSR